MMGEVSCSGPFLTCSQHLVGAQLALERGNCYTNTVRMGLCMVAGGQEEKANREREGEKELGVVLSLVQEAAHA